MINSFKYTVIVTCTCIIFLGTTRLSEIALMKESCRNEFLKSFYDSDSDEMSLLQQLLSSDQVATRKAAMIFLKSLVIRQIIPLNDTVIQMCLDSCQDPLLSVRKNGISSFTQIMAKTSSLEIQASLNTTLAEESKLNLRTKWLEIMLEKFDDLEKSVKEEAIGAISFHVIENLKYPNHEMWLVLENYPPGRFEDFESNMGRLLEVLKSTEKLNPRILFKNSWHQLRATDGAFATAWIFLRLIFNLSGEKRHFKPEETYNFFQDNIENLSKKDPEAAGRALKFMTDFIDELAESDKQQLFHDSRVRLSKLPVRSLSVLSSYASLLQKDEAKNLQDWLKQNYNLNRFEKAARKLVETNSVDHDFERRWHELVIWAITLSEFLTILTPDEVEEFSTVLLVVYFEMVDSGVEIPEYLVNSMIHVQCRICAVNADMAESTMPFFAHQLEFNKNPKTRATALSALADLCTVKTQLVDQFLDVIAATLDDRSLYVRCVALKQLTNLLKKDFIKLRPSILSRMLIQAADKDPKIKKVAEKASYCLTYVLAPRQPTLFYSHFTGRRNDF